MSCTFRSATRNSLRARFTAFRLLCFDEEHWAGARALPLRDEYRRPRIVGATVAPTNRSCGVCIHLVRGDVVGWVLTRPYKGGRGLALVLTICSGPVGRMVSRLLKLIDIICTQPYDEWRIQNTAGGICVTSLFIGLWSVSPICIESFL